MPVIITTPFPAQPFFKSITHDAGGVGATGEVVLDPTSDSLYSVGQENVSGPYVIKFDTDLDNILWSRNFTLFGANSVWASEADSSGNIYVAGYTEISGPPFNREEGYVIKYDSSGTLLWETYIGSGGPPTYGSPRLQERIEGMTIDSSGNVYLLIEQSFADTIVVKLNSSGVIQWQRLFAGVRPNSSAPSKMIGTDSTGDVYFATSGFNIFKLDTSTGAVLWKRQLTGQASPAGPTPQATGGLRVTSAGNVYISGNVTGPGSPTGGTEMLVVKYNSSGGYVWGRTLGDASASALTDAARGLAIDPAENVYVTGFFVSMAPDVSVGKFNSAGALKWERTWINAGVEFANGNCVADNTYLYMGGQQSNLPWILRIPTKTGGTTGSCGTASWSSGSLTARVADHLQNNVSSVLDSAAGLITWTSSLSAATTPHTITVQCP